MASITPNFRSPDLVSKIKRIYTHIFLIHKLILSRFYIIILLTKSGPVAEIWLNFFMYTVILAIPKQTQCNVFERIERVVDVEGFSPFQNLTYRSGSGY